ncbi:MAG: recombination mediator RecR [Pseudomonadales bacterium]|nr:recombination mediator RecR [Pseudomonadales bacterium]MDP6471744.1 recombination mediator RecR [Pseudomonadales bacterium]MDP6971424.1 recombination mediator RecR [Pseudomonadales bacterium]
MTISPLIDRLIEALQILPGVGSKGAQRMALHILQRNREGGQRLAEVIARAVEEVRRCDACRTLCEERLCSLCADTQRGDELLCVVESPADILAIEQAGGFRGRYFVLHGHLSPIEGVGPEDLGLEALGVRVRALKPREVILATNPTVEGEATAHYISDLLGNTVERITRIAHGVPIGGELEYIDGGTIVHAIQGRRNIT